VKGRLLWVRTTEGLLYPHPTIYDLVPRVVFSIYTETVYEFVISLMRAVCPAFLFVLHLTNIWCLSHWPQGLRHETSSPAQALRSWVRIQLGASMFLCVYSVFMLSCVGSIGLIPRPRRTKSLSREGSARRVILGEQYKFWMCSLHRTELSISCHSLCLELHYNHSLTSSNVAWWRKIIRKLARNFYSLEYFLQSLTGKSGLHLAALWSDVGLT
jgi:hypothetical protein